MSEQGVKEIVLVVKNEEALYVPYDQESSLNPKVRTYITSKIRGDDIKNNLSFQFKVISDSEIDQERFKEAVRNWIRDDKEIYADKLKQNTHVQKVLIIVGIVFLALSMLWEKMIGVSEFIYRILATIGSFSLGKVVSILVLDRPTNEFMKRLIEKEENSLSVVFEVKEPESTEV